MQLADRLAKGDRPQNSDSVPPFIKDLIV
jgi:hypothetical protein